MTIQTYSRKVTTATAAMVEDCKGVLAVKIGKEKSFLASAKQLAEHSYQKPKASVVTLLESLDHYIYADGPKFEKFCDVFGDGVQFYSEFGAVANEDAFSIIARKDFDPAKLLRIEWNSHTFYPLDSNMPWSPPYRVHYIGGVCNDEFDLDTAEKILKADPRVSKIRRMDIPYYNRDDGCYAAVEFTVQLPQEEHDKLVRYWRDKKKVEYWGGSIRDSLVYANYKPFDVLGLKKAYITKVIGAQV